MRTLLLLAGAAVLTAGSPALSKPNNGHGNGHGNNHEQDARTDGDRDRNDGGYRDGDRRNDDRQYGYNGRNCPPGLAKKNNGCQPPGHARRLARGQRYQSGYGRSYSYNQLPSDLRRQYNLNSSSQYYYDNGTLYGVNRRSGVIEQVLNALLR